jgi:hypothetical protein
VDGTSAGVGTLRATPDAPVSLETLWAMFEEALLRLDAAGGPA